MESSDTQDARIRHADRALGWILRHWPNLYWRTPARSQPFSLGYGYCDGTCTMPEVANKEWFTLPGGKIFAVDSSVPDGFFALGLRNRSSSEWLIAMWREGERRFWLCDQYVVFVEGSTASPANTSRRIDAALKRWDAGEPNCVLNPV